MDDTSAESGFLALIPDEEGRRRLDALQDALRRSAPGMGRPPRWVEPDALHLTLRFLGRCTAQQVAELRDVLPALAQSVSPARCRRFGVWPNRARPRVLVVELETGAALRAIAARCEESARAAGFAAETRPLRAHITLARLLPGAAPIQPEPPDATLLFDRIALLDRAPAGSASRYVALAQHTLRGPA